MSASLITGPALPGDDITQRMLPNSIRLFTLLTAYDETASHAPKESQRLTLPGCSTCRMGS